MNDNQTSTAKFKAALAIKADLVNTVLMDLLNSQPDIQPDIAAAMRYTLQAPGKRIRAAVVFWACEIVAGRITYQAKIAAAAMEMVHAYSLVHDDLPAMDDDNMRRGQPTCHKKFDEATAILTGDAILTNAFELLADRIEDLAIAVKLVKTLAKAAGPAGMIAGQMQDLNSENAQGTIELLEYIHTNKTAKMFAAAAAMGAIAGQASDQQVKQLYRYGMDIGLSFQVSDDLLDIFASSQQLGKTAGKDQAAGKVTYPAVVGVEQSKAVAKRLTEDAIDALKDFDSSADILRQLATELLDRTK